jgi:hypothetical protein
VGTPVKQSKTEPKIEPAANGHVAPDHNGTSVTGLAALIRDAEFVHEELARNRARTKRLAIALRKQRWHEHLVASTLASLKELKLQEVSGWVGLSGQPTWQICQALFLEKRGNHDAFETQCGRLTETRLARVLVGGRELQCGTRA